MGRDDKPCAEATIRNRKGLHARASAKFVKCAETFNARVKVTRDGQTVGGTSIMGLMMLAAGPGAVIFLEAEGPEGPEAIRGKIEVRGLGIIAAKHVVEAELALIVELTAEEGERLPERTETARLLGIEVPRVRLTPWHASAPIKLALALAAAAGSHG